MFAFPAAMPSLRRFLASALAVGLLCGCTFAGGLDEFRPYDDKADAKAQIAALLAHNPAHKRVLLTFGANWCSDSRALESHYRSPELAALLEREFLVLHVDTGTANRNLDVVERYGDPIDEGIPSVVLLDAGGNTLFVSHGELSSAETMGAAQIMEYFRRLARGERSNPDGEN